MSRNHPCNLQCTVYEEETNQEMIEIYTLINIIKISFWSQCTGERYKNRCKMAIINLKVLNIN